MALRKIITTEEEMLLRRISKNVDRFDAKLEELIEDMKETLHKANGLGLAAPQIGILKRVVLCNIDEKVIELVNPQIVKQSGQGIDDIEGCLSVPGKRGHVVRPSEVTVRAQDRKGKHFVIKGKDYGARVLCHEIDHLDGILYTDKVTSMTDV